MVVSTAAHVKVAEFCCSGQQGYLGSSRHMYIAAPASARGPAGSDVSPVQGKGRTADAPCRCTGRMTQQQFPSPHGDDLRMQLHAGREHMHAAEPHEPLERVASATNNICHKQKQQWELTG